MVGRAAAGQRGMKGEGEEEEVVVGREGVKAQSSQDYPTCTLEQRRAALE